MATTWCTYSILDGATDAFKPGKLIHWGTQTITYRFKNGNSIIRVVTTTKGITYYFSYTLTCDSGADTTVIFSGTNTQKIQIEAKGGDFGAGIPALARAWMRFSWATNGNAAVLREIGFEWSSHPYLCFL